MTEAVTALAGFVDWLAGQPIVVQVVVGVGVLVLAYALWVVLRVLPVAPYGAFRGLG